MRLLIIALHLCAAVAPFAGWHGAASEAAERFPGWPQELAGRPLNPLPMTVREQAWSEGFPGKVGRFNDGSREIIIRYVTRPTRRLHPSADCLRGSGYRVSTKPAWRDADGGIWGCVLAERGDQRYRVCERIRDQAGNGWYDVSSWYWSALSHGTDGPWWAITVAERV